MMILFARRRLRQLEAALLEERDTVRLLRAKNERLAAENARLAASLMGTTAMLQRTIGAVQLEKTLQGGLMDWIEAQTGRKVQVLVYWKRVRH